MRPAHLEHEHGVEPAQGPPLVVVVDADRPDGDVAELLVDVRPPLAIGGQSPDHPRLAHRQGDVVVVGVLVADGDEVGAQAGRQLVALALAEGIHEHARAGSGLEQKT